jgi:hypothetical protein
MKIRMTPECFRCGAKPEAKTLRKCPICFRFYCDDCATSKSGRRFCSPFCAASFFHGDEDDF